MQSAGRPSRWLMPGLLPERSGNLSSLMLCVPLFCDSKLSIVFDRNESYTHRSIIPLPPIAVHEICTTKRVPDISTTDTTDNRHIIPLRLSFATFFSLCLSASTLLNHSVIPFAPMFPITFRSTNHRLFHRLLDTVRPWDKR